MLVFHHMNMSQSIFLFPERLDLYGDGVWPLDLQSGNCYISITYCGAYGRGHRGQYLAWQLATKTSQDLSGGVVFSSQVKAGAGHSMSSVFSNVQ